jgi:hypothetical protein
MRPIPRRAIEDQLVASDESAQLGDDSPADEFELPETIVHFIVSDQPANCWLAIMTSHRPQQVRSALSLNAAGVTILQLGARFLVKTDVSRSPRTARLRNSPVGQISDAINRDRHIPLLAIRRHHRSDLAGPSQDQTVCYPREPVPNSSHPTALDSVPATYNLLLASSREGFRVRESSRLRSPQIR